MKHFLFFVLSCTIFSFSVNAQELKRTEADWSDYIPLLNAAGYEVFTFDISSLKDETYDIEFIVREYEKGTLVEDPSASALPRFILKSRRMLSDFPEEYWNEIIAEGPIYDLDKGILTLGEKISIGFSPAADSLKTMMMTVENIGAVRKPLPLKSQTVSPGKEEYMYDYFPFNVDNFQLGEFTPLVMLGSYWFDEETGYFRFCGESELNADMSSKILSSIPHYYVIGMIVTKNGSGNNL